VISASAAGVVIDVRVIPRASRSAVAGVRGDSLLVRINAAPLDGAANAELIEVLATVLGVPRRAVSIVAGERSRQKRVQVLGIDANHARRALTIPAATSDR
jgi:uncharacterized protein (TIGR00251 family)